MIRAKRVYDPAGEEDGARVLVDRLWPRGMAKDRARIDLWLKEIAPSDRLRKKFSHDLALWETFRCEYRKELEAKKDVVEKLRHLEEEKGTVTLLYAARDRDHNNAQVLREFLREKDLPPRV